MREALDLHPATIMPFAKPVFDQRCSTALRCSCAALAMYTNRYIHSYARKLNTHATPTAGRVQPGRHKAMQHLGYTSLHEKRVKCFNCSAKELLAAVG